MRRALFYVSLLITGAAVVLQGLGYVWHRPPEPLFYAILLINYAPKWVWILPAVILVLLSWKERLFYKGVGVLLLVFTVWMQDIQIKGMFSSPSATPDSMSVMTLNTGGASAERVSRLVNVYKPDIIMLQETREKTMKSLFNASWFTHCAAHICIASRFEMKLLDAYNRAAFSDWGSFAAAYEIMLAGKKIRLVNAHLETPRDALGGRPLLDYSESETDEFGFEKHTELSILAALMDISYPAIIAGDLNTSVFEAAYQYHLGRYVNAIDAAATGINYTKFTRWHGVRIDHVIANDNVIINGAKVLEDTGGDHRAVLANFSIVE
ncbi:endonuclease/exonuclease/phosphatase family protein [Alteromonas halophila]|uniref:Endonuclease/exonuclease/phosphatase domain-containing protein n=1 Tax=Alteromonas halophila TaxID=516698 RepID=A0A918JL24_9ALTE|nr:endonuclease/exonuclease/phosphatase family protein [Alteromonas halophila]GGW86889.1 hypothetical protein GCM10007391_20820 [Alteromonas halophila]